MFEIQAKSDKDERREIKELCSHYQKEVRDHFQLSIEIGWAPTFSDYYKSLGCVFVQNLYCAFIILLTEHSTVT